MTATRALLFALILALPIALGARADADLWWHVAAGRLIVESGGLPATDPWSYAASGAPWINHEWLPGIALATAYDVGGALGLLLVRGAVIVGLLAAWLVAVDRRVESPPLTLLLVGLPWPLLAPLCNLRPQTLTWALVPVVVLLVDRVARGSRPAIVALILTVWFWANAHGGFLFGWGVAGLGLLLTALGVERRDPLPTGHRVACLVAAVAIGVAPAFTPNGLHLLGYLWTELTTPHPDLPEWNPPAPGLLVLLLAVAATPVAAWLLTRARVAPTAWIALAIATIQATQHAKFIALVLLLAPLCLADVLGPALRAWRARDPDLVGVLDHPASRLGALAVALLATFPAWPGAVGQITVNPSIYADRAIAWLHAADTPRGGRLLVPLGWGGQAIYWLHPRWTVGNDGRNTTVYSAEHVARHARAWVDGDVAAVLEGDPDAVLGPARSPLTRKLVEDPAWNVAYRDRTAVLLVRVGTPVAGPAEPTVTGTFP